MTQRADGPSAAAKLRVFKRDRFRCTYCGVAGTDAELEADHIIAVARGGSHHISNLTTACRSCNQAKGAGSLPRSAPLINGPRQRARRAATHPLIGMWFHTLNADGEINYQGQILGIDGDLVLAQLYEWIVGAPSCVKPLAKAVFYSDACRLYSTNEDMNDAYEHYAKRREFERARGARSQAHSESEPDDTAEST